MERFGGTRPPAEPFLSIWVTSTGHSAHHSFLQLAALPQHCGARAAQPGTNQHPPCQPTLVSSITLLSISHSLAALASSSATARAAAACRSRCSALCTACATGGTGGRVRVDQFNAAAAAHASSSPAQQHAIKPTHDLLTAGAAPLANRLLSSSSSFLPLACISRSARWRSVPPHLRPSALSASLSRSAPGGQANKNGIKTRSHAGCPVKAIATVRAQPARHIIDLSSPAKHSQASPSISSSSAESKASRSRAPELPSAAAAPAPPPSPRSSHPATCPACHFSPNSASSCMRQRMRVGLCSARGWMPH